MLKKDFPDNDYSEDFEEDARHTSDGIDDKVKEANFIPFDDVWPGKEEPVIEKCLRQDCAR